MKEATEKKPTPPLSQALKNVHVLLQQEISKQEKENLNQNVVRTPKPIRAGQGQASHDDVTYLTQDAVDKSINFPTWPLINLLHQEAQDYLDSKQVDKAALTLLQFQSTQIRHQAVFRYNRRLRVAADHTHSIKQKANTEKTLPPDLDVTLEDTDLDQLEKNILDFRQTRDEGGRDLLRMIGHDLPPEWRIVQLTIDMHGGAAGGGRFKREPKDEPIIGHNFGMLMVTADCGKPASDQTLNVVRVPALPRQNNMPTIMKEFSDILELHVRMYKSDQVADRNRPQLGKTYKPSKSPIKPEKSPKSPEENKAGGKSRQKGYKELKGQVDSRLTSLMDTVEQKWLGWTKVLLLGHPVLTVGDQDRRAVRLENAARELHLEFFKSDPEFVPSGRRQCLAKILDGADLLTEEQLAQGLLYVLDGDEARLDDLTTRMDELLCPETEPVVRHPVVLVLDRHIQQLPWESLKCLQSPPQPMSRVPSASFLCALSAAHRGSKTSVSKTGIRQDKIFYVLNPDKNLESTQKRLEGELGALGGEGKVGEHPSLPEMKRVLEGMDAFMYCGHGSSLRTMPTTEIEKLRVRAMPLLFGCRSGQMARMGRSLDPIGPASSYLIASAPCILGFLWGITDRDIDQWTVVFLHHWLGTTQQEGSQSQQVAGNQKEFVRAVAEQRSKFIRFVNSAATVVYGLPAIHPE